MKKNKYWVTVTHEVHTGYTVSAENLDEAKKLFDSAKPYLTLAGGVGHIDLSELPDDLAEAVVYEGEENWDYETESVTLIKKA